MALLMVLTTVALVTAARSTVFAQNDRPDCVEVEGVARWAAASFNHWVVVHNRCEEPVRCTVATDVSPEPHRLDVPAGQRREVLTRRGSPARSFAPRVQCDVR